MRPRKLPEDREVLRAKFDNVVRLLAAYEDGIAQMEAGLHTFYIMGGPDNGGQLLAALRDQIVRISNVGIGIELIEGDLQMAQKEMGEAYAAWFTECWRELGEAQKALAVLIESPGNETAVLQIATNVMLASLCWLKLAMEPAKLLRQRLTNQLNAHPRERVETAGQRARRLRDDRIKLLALQAKITSPAKLLRLAKGDQILKKLNRRVTRDVVRAVLDRLKKAELRHRTKNTRQAKKRSSK